MGREPCGVQSELYHKLVGIIERKVSENCNLLVGTGEAKCCGETEISTELWGAERLLVGDSAVFWTCLMWLIVHDVCLFSAE